jgi:hypothetical protein
MGSLTAKQRNTKIEDNEEIFIPTINGRYHVQDLLNRLIIIINIGTPKIKV